MDDRILDTFGGRLFACRVQTGKSKLYFQKNMKLIAKFYQDTNKQKQNHVVTIKFKKFSAH